MKNARNIKGFRTIRGKPLARTTILTAALLGFRERHLYDSVRYVGLEPKRVTELGCNSHQRIWHYTLIWSGLNQNGNCPLN